MNTTAGTPALSIPDLIASQCEPDPKEKGKFICPVCEHGNLSIGKTGKWNCWSDPSKEHRAAIAKALTGQTSTGQTSTNPSIIRKTQKQRDREKDVAAAIALSAVEMKVEELAAAFDPQGGISKNKLMAEMSTWCKAHGHEAYAAKQLLCDRLKDRVPGGDSDQCKLARSYHKIQAIWGDRLRFNERTSEAELDGEAVDLDAARIDLALSHNYQVAVDDFQSVILSLAKQESYDPVAIYLNKVAAEHQPSGSELLEGIAARYFGLNEPIYQAFIRKTLIAAVARVFKPGCPVQHALILQGPQGWFKSTFFRLLCGENYFDDTMGSATDKDERLKLHRFWFIEWAELESLFKRKDISTVKAFISTSFDNIRPPYGRQTQCYQRRSVIVGTTNEDSFLRDPTGNRRFWVIPIAKSIPVDQLIRERDQIWAAAVHAYRAGEPWYLESQQAAIASQVAAEFEDTDPWEPFIEDWIAQFGRSGFSTNEVLECLFKLEKADIDRKQQMRVSECLKRLGWEQGFKGEARKRIWIKKKDLLAL
jgi:predicted P-loop ATPase